MPLTPGWPKQAMNWPGLERPDAGRPGPFPSIRCEARIPPRLGPYSPNARRTRGMISGLRDTQPGLLPRYDRGLPPGWAGAHTHHEARREHLPIRTWPWLAGQPNVLTHERLARPPAAANHSHRMSPGRGGRARCPAWLCRQRRAARVGSGNCSVSLLAAASTAAARPLALCEPPPFRTDWTRHRPPHRPPRSLTPGLTLRRPQGHADRQHHPG